MSEVARRLALGLLGVAACSTRVSLPEAPTAAAPLRVRQRFYRSHRPANLLLATQAASGDISVVAVGTLTLANGIEVRDPRDLLPLVAADSTVSHAAGRWAHRRAIIEGVSAAGATLAGAGLAVGFTGLFTRGFGSEEVVPWLLAGLITGAIGAILTAAVPPFFSGPASDDREEAFRGLDAALRVRMRLCGEGDTPSECP